MSVCVVQAQDYTLWSAHVLSGMRVEESIRDVATCSLQLAQHQQLWAEIEAREESYTRALAMGEELLQLDPSHAKEVGSALTLTLTCSVMMTRT